MNPKDAIRLERSEPMPKRFGRMVVTLYERSDERAPQSIEIVMIENDPGQDVLRAAFCDGSLASFETKFDDGEVLYYTARIRGLKQYFP